MRSRTSLMMASVFSILGAAFVAAPVAAPVVSRERDKKRRFGAGGTAHTKGKRSRSLKMRANRRKAKAKVK